MVDVIYKICGYSYSPDLFDFFSDCFSQGEVFLLDVFYRYSPSITEKTKTKKKPKDKTKTKATKQKSQQNKAKKTKQQKKVNKTKTRQCNTIKQKPNICL